MEAWKVLAKMIEDTQKTADKCVEREAWAEANSKIGYHDGMTCWHITDKKLSAANKLRSEKMLEDYILRQDYGKAAYYTAWLNGYAVAKKVAELAELQEAA